MNIWKRILCHRLSDTIFIILFFGTFIPGWVLVNTKPYEMMGAYILIPSLFIMAIPHLPPVKKILDEQQFPKSVKPTLGKDAQ